MVFEFFGIYVLEFLFNCHIVKFYVLNFYIISILLYKLKFEFPDLLLLFIFWFFYCLRNLLIFGPLGIICLINALANMQLIISYYLSEIIDLLIIFGLSFVYFFNSIFIYLIFKLFYLNLQPLISVRYVFTSNFSICF